MLTVLASGTLIADPQRRTSTAGKAYTTALLRVPVDGETPSTVSIIAFEPSAVAAILALGKGDSCAIAGRAKISTWTKDGEQRHGLSVVCEQVLTAYLLNKRRNAVREASDRNSEREYGRDLA